MHILNKLLLDISIIFYISITLTPQVNQSFIITCKINKIKNKKKINTKYERPHQTYNKKLHFVKYRKAIAIMIKI